jgi:predicted ArsR family transcriptional regulator
MARNETTVGFEVYELPTYTTSASELAEKMKVDYPTAQGYIKMLVKMGLATEAGSRKVAGAKGKPTKLYSIPTAIRAAA